MESKVNERIAERILNRGRDYSEMARVSKNQDLQAMVDYQIGVKFGLFLAAQILRRGTQRTR